MQISTQVYSPTDGECIMTGSDGYECRRDAGTLGAKGSRACGGEGCLLVLPVDTTSRPLSTSHSRVLGLRGWPCRMGCDRHNVPEAEWLGGTGVADLRARLGRRRWSGRET